MLDGSIWWWRRRNGNMSCRGDVFLVFGITRIFGKGYGRRSLASWLFPGIYTDEPHHLNRRKIPLHNVASRTQSMWLKC
jgi:hypothetical protein